MQTPLWTHLWVIPAFMLLLILTTACSPDTGDSTPMQASAPASVPLAHTVEACPNKQEAAYFLALGEQFTVMGGSLGKLSPLFAQVSIDPSILFNQKWKIRVAVQAASIVVAADTIMELSPPSSAGGIHTMSEEVAYSYKEAMAHVLYGIDNVDVDALTAGNSLIVSANETIGIAHSAILIFCQQGEVTQVPTATLVPTKMPPATPRYTSTPFPTIRPTPNVQANRATIEAIDAQKRLEEHATRTATEAAQEDARYAASLEATRVAQIPTPTPIPTPTALPTSTPHPSVYCREWEALVLDWIKEGNTYGPLIPGYSEQFLGHIKAGENFELSPPSHPRLSAQLADDLCITSFPHGRLYNSNTRGGLSVGPGIDQLLLGTYRYQAPNGDGRVEAKPSINRTYPKAGCLVKVNKGESNETAVQMFYGEPFEITLRPQHNLVTLDDWAWGCWGFLYRAGE